MPSIMEAVDELRALFAGAMGGIDTGLGGVLGALPGFLGLGGTAHDLHQQGQQQSAESQFLSAMLTHFAGNVPTGAEGAPQAVPPKLLPANVTVNVSLPASAGKDARSFALTTAGLIAQQLKLQGNFDLTL